MLKRELRQPWLLIFCTGITVEDYFYGFNQKTTWPMTSWPFQVL
jgi:hypothetical protein